MMGKYFDKKSCQFSRKSNKNIEQIELHWCLSQRLTRPHQDERYIKELKSSRRKSNILLDNFDKL